jgi:methyl-accepting chemotaxis protein
MFFEEFQGQDVIRGIRTIDAIESCTDCHEVNVGEPMAVLSVRYSIENVNSAITTQRVSAVLGALFTILISFIIIKFILDRQVINRLMNLINGIKKLAKGDISEKADTGGNDELSEAGQSLSVLQECMRDKVQIAQQIASGNLTEEVLDASSNSIQSPEDVLSISLNEMVANLRKLFAEIAGNSNKLSGTASELNEVSGTMSQEAVVLKERAGTVAHASTEMSNNITAVSTSTEEMSASVSEIAQNLDMARNVTSDAVAMAKNTGNKISELDSSASEINAVIEMIEEIAEQTKLLALNATIEAARAGEAGKGFAVVAGEVKDLAQQTNSATEDIRTKISSIQSSTGSAVKEIEKISNTISEINELTTMIASALEEQSVTTRSIADNIFQTAELSKNVLGDIEGANQAASSVEQASSRAHQNAIDVSAMGKQLQSVVEQIKL